MVGRHSVAGRRGAIDDRHGRAYICDPRSTTGNDDHPVDTAFDQAADCRRLLGNLSATVSNQHAETGGSRRLLDCLRDLRKQWIGDIRQHQPDNACPPRSERPRCMARHITKLLRRLPDFR
ncbi:hypothetical protein D3C73_726440 [compost metagenome]